MIGRHWVIITVMLGGWILDSGIWTETNTVIDIDNSFTTSSVTVGLHASSRDVGGWVLLSWLTSWESKQSSHACRPKAHSWGPHRPNLNIESIQSHVASRRRHPDPGSRGNLEKTSIRRALTHLNSFALFICRELPVSLIRARSWGAGGRTPPVDTKTWPQAKSLTLPYLCPVTIKG